MGAEHSHQFPLDLVSLKIAFMAGTFTVVRDGVETTRSAGYNAELHAVTRGYSNSYSFGYCKDISAYCEIDDCMLRLCLTPEQHTDSDNVPK